MEAPRIRQNGLKHEWRDLTPEESKLHNGGASPDASWYKTRVCERCGTVAPDYLDPDYYSCNELIVKEIHTI